MFRFSLGSLALSLLPVAAVPVALWLGLSHGVRSAAEPETLVLYQSPSLAMDPVRVRQLARLRREIAACERTTRPGLPHSLHPNLSAEYRLIVRETTPGALRRAGLPADIR